MASFGISSYYSFPSIENSGQREKTEIETPVMNREGNQPYEFHYTIPKKTSSQSRVYRIRLLSENLQKIIPLLTALEPLPQGDYHGVVSLVNIRNIVTDSWKYATSDDEGMSLFLTSLEKLFSKNFYKWYTISILNAIKSILMNYSAENEMVSYYSVNGLMTENNISILSVNATE